MPVVENPELKGDQAGSVRARFVDGAVQLEVGPAATPRLVRAHVETLRILRQFEGPLGFVRRLLSRIGNFLELAPGFRSGTETTEGFEARLELTKLGSIKAELEQMIADIDAHAARLSKDPAAALDSVERAALTRELGQIEQQLADNQTLVDSYQPGKGFVAAEAGDVAGAREAYESALAERPDDAQARPDHHLVGHAAPVFTHAARSSPASCCVPGAGWRP